jgi:hypothetical protein
MGLKHCISHPDITRTEMNLSEAKPAHTCPARACIGALQGSALGGRTKQASALQSSSSTPASAVRAKEQPESGILPPVR